MNKESTDIKEIEKNIDRLLNKTTMKHSPFLHSQNQSLASKGTETVFEIPSNQTEEKKENTVQIQKTNNEQKSDISTNLTEKYRLIALNTSDLIAFTTFDMNPVYTFISPSHKKILGFTEDEILGKPGLDFIHEDDIERLLELLLPYIEAKLSNTLPEYTLTKTQNIDFRFRDKSGQWHFLQSTVDIVKNELLFISKDITDQKKAQEALVESEKRYRKLYDNLMDGFAAVDLNGTITECNAAFVRMLGYTLTELRKLTYEDITPKKWHELEERILNDQVKQRGYSDLYEKEYQRKDGSIIPVELQTYLINDDQNHHCGYWAFIRDISIRKKMDTEQKENQDRIKAIVMNAPIGIATCGGDRYFISANDAFCKILGYTESELQKMTFEEITHPEDITLSNNNIKALFAGKFPYFTQEKRYVRKDKNIIVGKIIVSVIRDKENVPYLYIAELEDITERKKMEEALKKSEEKFVKAFKSSPVAIAITRISDGRFLEVNKALEKLIGYTRDELLANTTIALNIWIDSNDRKILFDKLGRDGSVYDDEHRFRSKNGNVIITRYSGEVIDFSGERAVLSVLIDITDYKKADDLLRESEEKYRSIVENSQDIIMLTNPDGQVGYISPACQTVLGYQPDDIIGKIPEIFYLDDVEKVNSILTKALQGVPGSNFQYRVVTKNGKIKWVSHSWSSIFNENHELKYVVSVVRDVTDIKLAEQNLKMKIEELEKYKNVTMNREIKMVQLKKEINELSKQLHLDPKYPEN
jgi:PAS domain S-box-containing protein